MSAATENDSPDLDNSITNRNVDERTNEPIINSENNQLPPKQVNTNFQNNSDENVQAVEDKVIVNDTSMEITRGDSSQKFPSKESTDDMILEKVPMSNESDNTISASASADDSLDNKQEIKEKQKVEIYELTNKMKEKLQLYSGNDSPDVKLRIIKEVFGENFEYEDYMQFLGFKRNKRNLLNENEVIMIDDDEDMLIEKVTEMPKPRNDGPPRLIKLSTKRKDGASDLEHRDKKLKTVPSSSSNNISINEIIIVDEDEEKEDSNTNVEGIQNNSDCNQNYITSVDDAIKREELPIDSLKEESNSDMNGANISINEITAATPNKSPDKSGSFCNQKLVAERTGSPIVNEQPLSAVVADAPIIEDISSDEETPENFRLHSRYDEKNLSGSTISTLGTSEVSHCTLANGIVNCIAKASNRDFFEKPLVYTRPVTPRRKHSSDPERTCKELEGPVEKRQWSCLANITHFEEDSSSTTSLVNVQPGWDKNYTFPKPGRHYPASPAYISMERVSPLTSPRYLDDVRYPRVSPMTSPNRRFSPNFRSPNRSVPTSPVGLSPSLAPTPSSVVLAASPLRSASTPVALGTTAVVSATPPAISALDSSRLNWQTWFAEEKRKGFFNFDRSQSVESDSASRRQSIETGSSAGSDYVPKVPTENYCEIKIDSKTYRIKRSLYERIPKGKLCYIRENNTFIRYFDDGQMELFIRNLNISEGSSIASDLLKQIKGRVEGLSDVETSLGQCEASGKSEVIALSKDVSFSTADNLSEPELYVEEVEKVQRYVPRDFYGFYKYVTGYQIVNHHPPISFQTFLTMHNTNGIRGLFKSYVNTLIEGHAVL